MSTYTRTVVKERLPKIGLELLILALAWYFLGIALPIVGVLAAIIIVANLTPAPWDRPVFGLGLIGLAALAYFHYHQHPFAYLMAAIGAIMIGVGLAGIRPKK